jgi:hypothetical protein
MINAMIGVSAARQIALSAERQPIPNLAAIRALVDTGASATCVDISVLRGLNLTPTGRTKINTPSTGSQPVDADQYDVSLIVPAALNQAPLSVGTLPVISAELLSSQGFHALIGRDILANCIFSYIGNMGLFSLAY